MTSTDPFSAPSTTTGDAAEAGGTASGSTPEAVGGRTADRDAAPQFVLPLVVRMERDAHPARTDALETSARAVLAFLSDDRSTGDGAWSQLRRDWEDARIRKVVRRARGAEWRRAAALEGITVHGRQAEVRVYPPVPLDGWPKELAKLQVSGTELSDPDPHSPDGAPAASPASPASAGGTAPAPQDGTPVLWLNPEVGMSAGKAMAQTGHAAQLAWWALTDTDRAAWREGGFALAVRTAGRAHWAELVRSGLPLVRDAGFTEVAPGSSTVVADHPALPR